MADQLLGVASVAVVILAYLLILEVMTAAIVLLATFTILQWRHLWSLLTESRPAAPAREVNQARSESGQPYLIGGNLRRWD